MHDFKPVVLHWSELRDSLDEATIEQMRESFTFLWEGSSSDDPTVLRPFRSDRDGFELLVPEIWADAQLALIGPDEYPGVTPFGAGTSALYRTNITAMTVSIGDDSGRIWICGMSECEPQVARTQEELEEVAQTAAHVADGVESTDIFIGGVRGGELHPSGFEFGAFRVAFGIVEGRPVMITVDDNVGGSNTPDLLTQIARSFRFLENDPSPAAGMTRYSDETIGFQIDVEDDWEIRELQA
jgi:hypothetical protein